MTVLLALFGFGRHADATPTPAPGVVAHVGSALHDVPVAIWVATIGLATAVAGPVVAHLLERRRSRE